MKSKNNPRKKGRDVKCDYCEKLIYKPLYHFKKYKKHYCSFDCSQKDRVGRGRRFTGKYVKCDYCGKKIYRINYHLKKRKHFFCSNKCCGKFQSKDKDFRKKISKGVKKAYKKGKKMGDWLKDEEIKKIRELCLNKIPIKEISRITGRSTRVCYEKTEDIRQQQIKKDLDKFKNNLKKLNTFQIGYILGIIDGEGSLTIGEHTNTPTKPHFFPVLDITNSNKEIIDYIQNLIPANYIKRIIKEGLKRKNIFVYRIYDRKKLEILLNFFKSYKWIKKKQAEIVLKFLNIKDDNKRRIYHTKIKELNKKGKII